MSSERDHPSAYYENGFYNTRPPDNPKKEDNFNDNTGEEDDSLNDNAKGDEASFAHIPYLDEDDLYSMLAISRDASTDDITQAYHRLSRIYHPDKHRAENIEKAQELFSKVKKAYEVLSNPAHRAIYNEIGMKGLETEGNELILRYPTPQEIQEEIERVRRLREERELERTTNPRGAITVNLNATELFNPYLRRTDEDEEEDYSPTGPLVEFSGFSFAQSIDIPLTLSDTFVLSGSVNAQNGRGTGNINCGIRKTLSNMSWGQLEMGGSTSGFEFGFKGFSQISPRYYLSFSGALQSNEESQLKPAAVMTVGSQLDPESLGTLTWHMGVLNGLQSVYIKEKDNDRFSFTAHVGFPHSYASIQATRKLDEKKLRIGGRVGTFGGFVEYGVEKKLSAVSTVSATMIVGLPIGVNLRFKVVRSHQTYVFPIQLSDEIYPAAIFYGTVIPMLVWLIAKKLVLEPIARDKLLREKEKKKFINKSRMLEKKIEAENAVVLMAETYKRIRMEEEKKGGLIIVSAIYGRLITSNSVNTEIECIDVTVPLQCIVKESSLVLHPGTKNSLPGFYDPAVGEDKNLMIKYKFHGELHETVVREEEPLKIPRQAHRVDPL